MTTALTAVICDACRARQHGENCRGVYQPCDCRCRAVLGLTSHPDPTAPSVLDQRHQPADCDCGCMTPPPPPPLPELVEQGPATCIHGHLLSPDNVKKRHDKNHWRCITCRRESERRQREWMREWANQPPKSHNAMYRSDGRKKETV